MAERIPPYLQSITQECNLIPKVRSTSEIELYMTQITTLVPVLEHVYHNLCYAGHCALCGRPSRICQTDLRLKVEHLLKRISKDPTILDLNKDLRPSDFHTVYIGSQDPLHLEASSSVHHLLGDESKQVKNS